MEFRHKSVLLEESIEELRIKPDGIYVDGTLGGGGHSWEICRRLSDKGRLIGIDQDAAAIRELSKEEFDGEMQKGMDALAEGKVRPAEEVFAELRSRYSR